MADRRKILVFGGTGNYGRQVVSELLRYGQAVRVVSRNAVRAKQILGEKVEIIEGNVTDHAVIEKSMADVDAVFIALSAVSPKLIRKLKAIEYDAPVAVIKAAEDRKVSRLVILSVYAIREDVLNKLRIPEFASLKKDLEERVRESDLNWTILGCSPMQDIFFTFLRKGRMPVPGGGRNAIPSVSAADVGKIAAQCLIRDDLGSKRFKLTGPEAYSFPQVAELISTLSGKPVKYITIPLLMINLVSALALPFTPFLRYIYKSLLLLNNFPEDEVWRVPDEYRTLRDTFDYEPVTLEMEIERRIASNEF